MSKPTERIIKEGKVDEFSTYFSSIVTILNENVLNLLTLYGDRKNGNCQKTNSGFKFEYVSNVFIRKNLKKINRKKATGLDEIPATVLKDCAKCLSQVITHIVNLSITTSTFPESWKGQDSHQSINLVRHLYLEYKSNISYSKVDLTNSTIRTMGSTCRKLKIDPCITGLRSLLVARIFKV